jgi:uncharacterized protein (TIGR02246 family)
MTDDEPAIRQVVETWMEASQKGDLDTVLGLMTEDVVFMVPGSAPFGRVRFAEGAQAMKGMKIDGRNDILEIEIAGGWAWLRGHVTLTITPPGGAPMQRSGDTLTIFRKGSDGRWRLARDANLMAAALGPKK